MELKESARAKVSLSESLLLESLAVLATDRRRSSLYLIKLFSRLAFSEMIFTLLYKEEYHIIEIIQKVKKNEI